MTGVQQVRWHFEAEPSLQGAVDAVAMWIGELRAAGGDGRDPDELLPAAQTAGGADAAAWCYAAGRPLPPMLVAELATRDGGDAERWDPGPVARYVLGRAAMRQVMSSPAGTEGLVLAYELVARIAYGGEAPTGGDDELADAFADVAAARAEVEAEAARLGADPEAVADNPDRGRTKQAVARAGVPASLEACSHRLIRGLLLDVTCGRVVGVVARREPAIAASLLAAVGNPALVAAMLSRFPEHDVSSMAQILRAAEAVFREDGRWNGGTTAWMVLLAIEERLLAAIEDAPGYGPHSTQWVDTPPSDVGSDLDEVLVALSARPDAQRLAIEWLAHLLWPVLASDGVHAAGRGAMDGVGRLLDMVLARLRGSGLVDPWSVWTALGGSIRAPGADGVARPTTLAPLWQDWQGQETRVVPLALTVLAWDGANAQADWLWECLRASYADMAGDPHVHLLAGDPARFASSLLARPFVHLPDPPLAFGRLWESAAWTRAKAAHAPAELARDAAAPCVALVRLGVAIVTWLKRAAFPGAETLAWQVADALDELRYLVLDMEWNWPGMAGSLAAAAAVAGVLDGEGCGALLARYDGDDECLATAAVNAVANGAPAAEVRRVLATLGDDACALAERWIDWNDALSPERRDRYAAFVEALRALAG